MATLNAVHLQQGGLGRHELKKDVRRGRRTARFKDREVISHAVPEDRATFGGIDDPGRTFDHQAVPSGGLRNVPVDHGLRIDSKVGDLHRSREDERRHLSVDPANGDRYNVGTTVGSGRRPKCRTPETFGLSTNRIEITKDERLCHLSMLADPTTDMVGIATDYCG